MKKWVNLASISTIILFTYQSISNSNIEWLLLFASFCGLILSRFIID